MKNKGFNIEKILQIAEKNASELSIDKFFNILNNLPLHYKFELNGISGEVNGNWVKRGSGKINRYKDKETQYGTTLLMTNTFLPLLFIILDMKFSMLS